MKTMTAEKDQEIKKQLVSGLKKLHGDHDDWADEDVREAVMGLCDICQLISKAEGV